MSRGTLLLVILTVSLLSGCTHETVTQQEQGTIILATTTSTYDSGLLDYLFPIFEEKYGIEVKVIPVGTGQAIELGRRGDVDVILVHSPKDEERFVSDGFGVERHCVMYNDFVILGPGEDPAGVKGYTAVDALKKIADTDSIFISRGDGSGTHKKELALWEMTGVEDMGSWYVETGTGMGQTLLVASEKGGYTLADRGTHTSMKDRLDLFILISGDRLLLNPYGIIAVNPQKNPRVNHAGAEKLIQWITSNEGQALIGGFTKNGEQLFTPLYNECPGD